jgi:hypothetical protein
VSPQLHQHLLGSNQVLVFMMNKKNGREMKKRGKGDTELDSNTKIGYI